MIKQQGGIFGRNPTFNNVDVEDQLTAASVDINGGSIDDTTVGSATPDFGQFTQVRVGSTIDNGQVVAGAILDPSSTMQPNLSVGDYMRNYSLYAISVANGGGIKMAFNASSRRTSLIELSVIADWSASNTATRHTAAKYIFRVFANSDGTCSIDGPTAIYEYVFSSGTHFVFDGSAGNFTFTVTILNPQTNVVEMECYASIFSRLNKLTAFEIV
jgi:hypothetical protein